MTYSLGGKLKRLRIKRGLSQDELAEKLNGAFGSTINKSMISKWENALGEPSLENARLLALFFNVTLDELLGINLDRQTETPNPDNEELSEEEIITLAAHRVGHEGALSKEQLAQIKLAMKIALAKEKDN